MSLLVASDGVLFIPLLVVIELVWCDVVWLLHRPPHAQAKCGDDNRES